MKDRLAAETEEEREARLQQMRVRLAAETPEEREARLPGRTAGAYTRVCFGGDIPAS